MISSPTLYEDLNGVLGELVTSARRVLKENFVGAYLQGSFAVGDFDEHSDADSIIVVQQPLDRHAVDALQEVHHQAVAGYEPSANAKWRVADARWRQGQIVRHGDLGPWNIVWRDGNPVGIIDWDFFLKRGDVEEIGKEIEWLVANRA